jgi:hypothetical protein
MRRLLGGPTGRRRPRLHPAPAPTGLQAAEMAECTFAPKTTPAPSYLAARTAGAFTAVPAAEAGAAAMPMPRPPSLGAMDEHAGNFTHAAAPAPAAPAPYAGAGDAAAAAAAAAGAALSAALALDSSQGRLPGLPGARRAALPALHAQMERELAELQRQWHAQQQAQAAAAAGDAAGADR